MTTTTEPLSVEDLPPPTPATLLLFGIVFLAAGAVWLWKVRDPRWGNRFDLPYWWSGYREDGTFTRALYFAPGLFIAVGAAMLAAGVWSAVT